MLVRFRQCRRMSRSVLFHLLSTLLLLVLFIHPITANIPYSPSYVLVSPQHNDSLAYLLLSSPSDRKTQFLSLNLSANVDSSKPQYSVLLDKAPFQGNSYPSAFTPVIDNRGIIKIFAGDCQNMDQAGVWQFSPSHNSSSGNGTWDKVSVDRPNGLPDETPVGPNYLAAGFTYSSSDTMTSSIYTFGGMCPFQNSSGKDWVSAAKYSNSMTVLNPSGPQSSMSYEIATTGDRAPPIAEAGFTMTPLRPASATTSSGNMMQQQNVLLIGGQTHNAFINMSELAVFSLPQNSWSFVTVGSELESGRTELAIRDTAAIEPRSGHSAVLTPDGSKVVVFGGWVGKTSVPADPQLAVLEVGEEYGGTGPWTWKVPSAEGIGLAEGAGIYGHGATMLPGGVMMIAGGYTISQPSKRSISGPQQNSQVYLYNVTSNNWVNSYVNPSARSAEASISHSGSLSSGQKAGLGVGLGLGLPALIGLVLLGWILIRKRRTRQKRDQHIRKLALGAERSHFWAQEEQNLANSMRRLQMKQIGACGADPDRTYPWAGNRGYGGRPTWRDNGEAVAERTGLLVDVPSPTRNSRQSFSAKICRVSGQFNEFRRSDPTGDIHPIDEREEEYEASPANALAATSREPERQSHDLDEPTDIFADTPFLTPRSTNFGGLFGAAHDRTGLATGSSTRAVDGRSSPEKDNNRTSSSLSDSSSNSAPAKQEVILQHNRAAAFTKPSSTPSSGRQSPEKSASISTHSKDTCPNGVDSAMGPVEKHQSADSFSTANTTISQRQAEAEHLLSDVPEQTTPPESPSKKSPSSKPKPSDWIGSIRRVLSVSKRNSSADPNASFAPIASGIDRRSTVIVPSKPFDSENKPKPPRRAISASAELFRRKQGAKDWGASRYSRGTLFRTPTSPHDDFSLALDGDEEDDWDVEGAAEDRSVQVTFTVPKEKLRVVNATDRDMDNMSEKSISRSSSKAVGGRVVSR